MKRTLLLAVGAALLAVPLSAGEDDEIRSDGAHSVSGAGISRGKEDARPGSARPAAGGAGSSSGGGAAPAAAPRKPAAPKAGAADEGAGFEVVDIGHLQTIGSVTGQASGAGRPVIFLGGGKKWAIRIRHRGPEKGAFPLLLGGTNGYLTGGGKYAYKAAVSKTKGSLVGESEACTGEMANAAYVTCQQPCSMKWELRFGTPKPQRLWKDLCELENDQTYYLNVAPVSKDGCTGGQAHDNGCPLVMEVANGGTLYLHPVGAK